MDVLDRADLPFPQTATRVPATPSPMMRPRAAYLENARWGDGFACPHCGTAGEPFHFENRPGRPALPASAAEHRADGGPRRQ